MRTLSAALFLPLCGCTLLFDAGGSEGGGNGQRVDGGATIDAAVGETIDANELHAECAAPWSAWSSRMRLSVNNDLLGTEALTNVPVLVSISSMVGQRLGLKEDGSDLRFSDADGVQLPYEIETWEPSSVSQVWVRLPEVPDGQRVRVWMYGGYGAAVDEQNREEVWSNDYRGVWHFSPQVPGGQLADSTASANTAAAVGSVSQASVGGDIGGSVSVADSSFIQVDDNPSLDVTDGITLEARVRLNALDDTSRFLFLKSGAFHLAATRDAVAGGNRPDFHLRAGLEVDEVLPGTTLTDGPWLYVAATYDTSERVMRLYINGIEDESVDLAAEVTSGISLRTNDNTLSIGSNLRGAIDEARISGFARSSGWIMAQQYSMEGTFVTNNGEMDCP